MNPWALIITLCAAAAILLLPRKYAINPLIIGIVLVPAYNGFTIGGIDLPVPRILVCCLLFRMLIRNESNLSACSPLDKFVLVWASWMIVSFVILTFSSDAIINRVGTVWVDLVLTYFLCRNYLSDLDSVLRACKLLIVLALVLGISTFLEYFNGFNLFTTIGGQMFVQIRHESIRCQGPFGHPITLGSYAALTVPMIWGIRKMTAMRNLQFAFLLILSIATVIFSGSSSPVLALGGALVGIGFWRFQHCLKQIRWCILAAIVFLELFMNAHVWWLMTRLNFMGGSAYHRARLLDHFAANFGDWWLFGTRSNAEWGGGGFMTYDVANHLLRMGTNGGILAILIFLLMFASAFRSIGQLITEPATPAPWKFMLWAFGCVLFAHLINFFGISYWDQMRFILYVHLAILAAAISIIKNLNASRESADVDLTSAETNRGLSCALPKSSYM